MQKNACVFRTAFYRYCLIRRGGGGKICQSLDKVGYRCSILVIRVRRFRKKRFCIDAKLDLFRMCFARFLREKKICFAYFASTVSLCIVLHQDFFPFRIFFRIKCFILHGYAFFASKFCFSS